MQWYLDNKGRLRIEVGKFERNGVNYHLCKDDLGNLLWNGTLSSHGHYHNNVSIVYPEHFPFEQIRIYILGPQLPMINNHIHGDGSICVMRPEEWNPNWTGYTMYLKAMEFLDDYYSGSMSSTYIPPLPVSPILSNRNDRGQSGIIGFIKEVFRPPW